MMVAWFQVLTQADAAKTYVLIAIIFTFIAAAVWIIVGILALMQPILGPILFGIGLVAFLIAILVYLTTYERIKLGDYAGATGPCLVWGLLDLLFGFGIAGIFLLLAHSKLSDLRVPSHRS